MARFLFLTRPMGALARLDERQELLPSHPEARRGTVRQRGLRDPGMKR